MTDSVADCGKIEMDEREVKHLKALSEARPVDRVSDALQAAVPPAEPKTRIAIG